MSRNFTVGLPASSWIGDEGAEIVAGDIAALPYLFATTQRTAIAFADGSDEVVAFASFVCPAEFVGPDTAKADIYWVTSVGDNTKTVDWDVYLEAITAADAVDLSTTSSFDSANASGGASCNATAYYLIKTTVNLSNDDAMAAGDLVRVGIRRDNNGTDTAAGTAYILDAEIYEDAA